MPLLSIQEFHTLLNKDEKEQRKRKLDPNLERDLKHGWILQYLIPTEDMLWGRWGYWLQMAETQKLPSTPIPQIDFDCGVSHAEAEGSRARRHLEECLDLIPQSGSWRGFSASTHLQYFLEWLIFGFGGTVKTLPKEPPRCKGASMRLFQGFRLAYLIGYPYDYWAGIFCELSWARQTGSSQPQCLLSR